ncbi:Phosphomannomutase [Trachipleistophora hominis]|uniref:Phosphomannomutase n=1 Tax=Trachipleistophora hominis TaxID=72359 RepID=L7JZZ3_TRAHO|nr:Phosphomannomutase [Trachipleistophora hominis]
MPKMTDTVFLFDVDGTLTPSRKKIKPDMLQFLQELRTQVYIAFVGGSNLEKQQEQVCPEILTLFDFSFPENGLSYYRGTELVSKRCIKDFLGEEILQNFVNFCLHYLSTIKLPVKRGLFIEMRDSMVNVSPVGRTCNDEERQQFFEYDKQHKIRENMVQVLKKEFGKYDMHFCIGGQISIDCFPKGWDKRYCLQHLEGEGIKNVYFFGDMVHEGGNDYEIFEDDRVVGIPVSSPSDTFRKCKEVLEEAKLEHGMKEQS